MRSVLLFIPAVLGFVIILQAGLNRKMSQLIGLPLAVAINATVFFVGSLLLVYYFKSFPANEGAWQVRWSSADFSWWWIIPGLCGLCLVVGGPWAISQWGAAQTFVVVISAQMLGSLLWDLYFEGIQLSPLRIAGVVLACTGASLVAWAKPV